MLRQYGRAMNPSDAEQGDADLDAVLRQTQSDFVGGFRAACTAMTQLIGELQGDTSGEARRELEQIVPRMGGLAGTIGFPTVSARARVLEDLLRDTPSEPIDTSRARALLDAIRLAFEQDHAG